MKTAAVFIAAITAVTALFGADIPCEVKQSRTSCWANDQLSDFAEHITIYNNHNSYGLDYMQWKPNQTQPALSQFWLFDPRTYGGFSRPLTGFIQLTVNGIKNEKLAPKKEDVVLWRKDNLAGCDISLNFDGAKIVVTWYMRPDSPVLWCSIKPSEKMVEPIKSFKIRIEAVPGGFARDEKNQIIWQGAYQPQAISPVRTIELSEKPIALAAEDSYLILQDAKLEDKTGGPCFITLDYTPLVSAELNMRNEAGRNLVFNLKPDFKEFTFGLWQQKNDIKNAAFLEKFKNAGDTFTLKPLAR